MKHIDKILPLSILVVNVILIINRFNSLYFVIIGDFFLNSNIIILGFSTLSVIVLTIFLIRSFTISTSKLKKGYLSVITLSLVLITAFFLNYKPVNNDKYFLEACGDGEHYLLETYPSGYDVPKYLSLLSSSNGIVFRELATVTYIQKARLFIPSYIRVPAISLIQDQKLQNEMSACLQ